MDRREFLQKHGLLALDFDWQQHRAPQHEGLATLAANRSHLFFLSNDDRTIDLTAAAAKHLGHPSTLSFMYTLTDCVQHGNGTCPNTAAALDAASAKDSSIHHFIVSVSPRQDIEPGKLQLQLDRYKNLRGHYTVLYPVSGTGPDIAHHAYALPLMVQTLQNDLGLITGGDNYRLHASAIITYDSTGKQRGEPITQDRFQDMAAEIIKRTRTAAAPHKAIGRQ